MDTISSPLFWAPWALGLTLHIFIYSNQRMGKKNATVVIVLQVFISWLVYTLSTVYGPLAAAVTIQLGNMATWQIIERMNTKRRELRAETCHKNLNLIVDPLTD